MRNEEWIRRGFSAVTIPSWCSMKMSMRKTLGGVAVLVVPAVFLVIWLWKPALPLRVGVSVAEAYQVLDSDHYNQGDVIYYSNSNDGYVEFSTWNPDWFGNIQL